MTLLSRFFAKLKLVFPDPIEEREFARLKAPLIKSSLTWLFVFIALVFVPLTFRYFDKHLVPQKYLGVSFIVCAVLAFLLRNKLEKWLEALSLLYVALMVILYIINMRLILKKQLPYEAFYMGYGLALIQRMLDFRIGTFIVIFIFHIVFHTLKFTLVEIPDVALGALVICLEVFPLILGYKSERADRILFDSLYNSKHQLLKFKNFLTECLPSQIVILDQNYTNFYFTNNAFNEVFKCKTIKDIKKAFKGLMIDNKNVEKNPTLTELIDNQQTITLSQVIEQVTQNKDLLQGLKDFKLQAIQQIVETSSARPKSPTTITKETQMKEEDFVLLKRDRLVDKESQRNLYNPTYIHVLEQDRLESSLELEHLPESAHQEGQDRSSSNIIKRDWHIRIFPITWDQSEAIAIVLDDVTYEKTIVELQVADQNKKDLVIGLISHELKTPLNGMLGMLDIVKRKLKNIDIKQADVFFNLDACKNNSLLLLNLINSIVDFSKIKTDVLKLSYTKVNIIDLLKKITPLFEHFCRSKNLHLRIEVDEDVPKTIITDRNRLTQILISLMGNAFKFTFAGGVTVRAHLESQNPNRVRLSVEDTGIGISTRDKEKLFKLFGVVEQKNTTINTHGMGLGLTICNALARMLNPSQRGVQVESEIGKGSVFSFMVQDHCDPNANVDSRKSEEIDGTEEILSYDALEEQRDSMSVRDKMIAYSEPTKDKINSEKLNPLSIEKCVISEDMDERKVRQQSDEKPWCLVVDDNPFNLMVAHNMMEDKGYNIMTALNGKEAIERAQEHQKGNKCFRLILMDCQMPVMDGYESTKALKKMMSEGQISECPIVALTANAKDAKHDRLSNEAGMSGFIPKPLQLVELEKVLKDVQRKSYQDLRSPVK